MSTSSTFAASDGNEYEFQMGRWSRKLAELFLDFVGTANGEDVLDVGCGTGSFWPYVSDCFDDYIGTDVVRHEGFPESATFYETDLDTGHVPLPDGHADVVASLETIEQSVPNPPFTLS